MNKKVLTGFVFLTLMAVLLPAMPVQAQSAAYFQAMTNLNPAGYWPMHEVEAPAPGDIETNWGTLGVLGNGYYADYAGITTNIGHGYAGALTNCLNSSDTAVNFNSSNVVGSASENFVIIPHTSPLMTIRPPFTAEAWVKCTGSPTNTGGMAFMGQGGNNGLNNVKKYDGFQCNWGYNTLAAQYYTGGNNTFTSFSTPSNYTASVWWHYVATYDGTNVLTYVNGVQEGGGTLTTMVPSKWSPLCIGSGKYSAGPNRAYPGYVDEVAIYTNVLSAGQIGNHYLAGTTTGSNYFQTVLNDNPLLYYHMDAPAYTAPSVGTWPALTNYGSVAGNGVYTPGSTPGSVAGPSNPSGVPWGGLLGTNAAPGNGMSSFGDAGNNALYNPTGSSATFSVSAMFQGNPADPRVQSIVGHGSNSWQLVLNTYGQIVFNAGTGGGTGAGSSASGDLTASITNNDGNWHQVVAVHNGTNNWLYVDGALNASNSSTVSIPGSAQDVMIGADPSFISNNVTQTASDALGKQFAGQVCEVAFFTNALTSNQVQTLYNASGVPVFITTQPVSASVNQGAGFTNTVVAGGSALAYQWYTNGVALPNQTNASLILNPVLPSYASTNYYVVVTNGYGSVTSAVVSLTVSITPTIVSQLPAAHTNVITLFAGASPTFSVSATGALPLYYFWVTNGVVVAGATNTSYTNAQAISLTNFYCIVSNFVGTATGTVWTVSVISDPTNLYPAAVLAAHPIGYWRLNEGPDDGNGNQDAICNDYLGGNNGLYTNVDIGQTPGYSALDPETSTEFGETIYSFYDSYAGQIAGIDFSSPTNTTVGFSVEAWINGFGPGGELSGGGLVSKGYGGGGEQFDLDLYTNSFGIGGGVRFFVRDAGGALHSFTSTNLLTGYTWHHVVGVCDEANGQVSLYIDGLLAGSSSIQTNAGILIATNLMTIGSRMSAAKTNNNFQFYGYMNDVALYNYALSSNQVAVQYVTSGTSPSFSQAPPTNVTVYGGGTLVIPAIAIGTPTLSYQWYDVNGGTNVVTGSTNEIPLNATLTVSNVPGNWNNDTLQLTVANTYGSTNVTVTLTVYTNAPQIITQDIPAQVTLASGKSYTYSIGVVGMLPISYQWYKVTTPVAGQTNSTYAVTAGSPGSTTYYVVITNIYGAVTSSVSTFTSIAPLANSYATNVLGVLGSGHGPVGYWPLQETNAPAPGNWETNYGSLGRLGNAYYACTNATNVAFDQAGALAGDTDPSVLFSGSAGTNPNSYAFVPRVSTALTIQAPFTLEAWVNLSTTTYGVAIGEGGGTGLNGGTNFGGWQMGMGASAGNQFQMSYYTGVGNSQNGELGASLFYTLGQWYHYVVTYDGLNSTLYVNGRNILTATSPNAADTWSPLAIGAGKWDFGPIGGIRWFTGNEDEVAIYTNVLSALQITNHYLAGTAVGSNYMQTVLADNPLLYYRMDAPGYTNPSVALYPEAVNYGSALPNGAYLPGIVPGEISGPPIAGLGTNSVAAPINGVISCVDAGYDPAFNPTGTQPFTAMTWFRTYPADGRVQTIMSHGTNWTLNLNGTSGKLVWNVGAGSVTSANILNDGNWHQVAGVYDGSACYLYVDGALNISGAAAGSLTSDAGDDLYLGGNAAFTQVGANQQYFSGAIAQAAFYTNALTATQIQAIYSAAASVTPTISVAHSGNNVTITYAVTLLSSTNATGPYQPVPGATNPYTTPATNAQQFYRSSSP